MSQTTTRFIPINRLSQYDLQKRTVPRRMMIDTNVLLTECGTISPLHEAPTAECDSILRKVVRDQLLNVNKAAVQAFIGYSQSEETSFPSCHASWFDDVSQSLVQATRLAQNDADDQEDEPADFYEPIAFAWKKKAHRIRQAAKRFSEQTHADY